jgi:hypothetical protein
MAQFFSRLARGKITRQEKEAFLYSFFSFTFLYIGADAFRIWFTELVSKYIPDGAINLLGAELQVTPIILGTLGMFFLFKLFRIDEDD